MIAALYVQEGGCYTGLDGVDPWPESRDARSYAGPYPVVAHPPCERWGAYSSGGPRYRGSKVTGDDGGCFASALASVRQQWRDQRRAWLRWRQERGLRVYATPELMSRRKRAATPVAFRDLLISIARSAS